MVSVLKDSRRLVDAALQEAHSVVHALLHLTRFKRARAVLRVAVINVYQWVSLNAADFVAIVALGHRE